MLVFLLSYLGAFDLIGLGRAALHCMQGAPNRLIATTPTTIAPRRYQ